LRIEWQSFQAKLIINKKHPDEEEFFNYLCSFISIDERYTRKIKSSIVTAKAVFKKYKPSLQILEEETVKCYIWSIAL
jgi:hypothetical protein